MNKEKAKKIIKWFLKYIFPGYPPGLWEIISFIALAIWLWKLLK